MEYLSYLLETTRAQDTYTCNSTRECSYYVVTITYELSQLCMCLGSNDSPC